MFHRLFLTFVDQGTLRLETAKALQRIMGWINKNNENATRQEAIERAAKICGRSSAWVTQHLGLLNLCPAVRDLMEKKQIPFQIGIALTSLKDEHQLSFATHIIKKGLEFRAALHYIRSNVDKDKLADHGRRRGGSASSSYSHLQRFMNNLERDLGITADLVRQKRNDMFKNHSAKEVRDFVFTIDEQIGLLRGMKDILQEIVFQKNTTQKAIEWAQKRKAVTADV